MDVVSNSQTEVEIQLSIFEAIVDLLSIEPIFLLGIPVICISLFVIFKRSNRIPKLKVSAMSLIMYYYLCLLLTNIVGIPTLREYLRLSKLGEAFFHPNVNLIPLSDGFGLSSFLNILLFIPLGFLCPLISKTFERARNTFFIGLSLSVFIEIIQLFTLYRVTDINDLLTNITGTMIGYLCFRLFAKLRLVKPYSGQQNKAEDDTGYLPVILMIVALVLGFFS